MELHFDNETFDTNEYTKFEKFWEAIPKTLDDRAESYCLDDEFMDDEYLGIDPPEDKQEMEGFFELCLKLDGYEYWDQIVIYHGLHFQVQPEYSSWADFLDADFDSILGKYIDYFDGYSNFEDAVESYLYYQLNISHEIISKILPYIDCETFVDDYFDVNGNYFYFK